MDDKLKPTEFAAKTGLSVPYASQILGGKRNPSRPLAIHIFRKTGWRHDVIAELTDAELEMLERIDPYQAREAA
jgi:transcriptional regulator with XRE-family HTH domain